MNKKYEIREVATNELLVDDLSADQALKVFEVYQDYFGARNIYLSQYKVAPKPTATRSSRAQDYKNEFILFFEELQEMGNLL